MTSLLALAPDLWIADRPLRLFVGDIGARMTVIRCAGGGLLLHSPVALDDQLRAELEALGPVRWVVGPSKVHHLFLAPYVAAFPGAALCGAKGLAEKRRDLAFRHELDRDPPPEWPAEIGFVLVEGAPLMNEVVFHHAPTRTLVLTDLAFHVVPGPTNRARFFHRLVGATGRFGPHRLIRLGIRDRRAAAASIRRILEWDFDRIVVSHGQVLERDGRARFESAFADLAAAR
jgi:Domain of unknown function (DUF4336)